MAFKINISEKGKSWRLEAESEALMGKKIGEKIKGEDISADLSGYEFEITGTSDIGGIPGFKEVDGVMHKRVLLRYGKGMHMRPKGLSKKPNKKPKGLRLRKTVMGNTISKNIAQINLKLLKAGSKKLEEIFPDQKISKGEKEKTEKKAKADAEKEAAAAKPAEEKPAETKPAA
jgi:ribosomal protein S6E (S10)